ncbi:FAD-dependent oxidoreductase [Spirosoma sp. KCTC 42546]|uniref:FAD-dependent oxidoreductase n=1 Tax=Spirosoma sp. KCTC 42546 TaxID=2520506 RepID=UPI00115A3FBB|nr:FAD-dependent oxidoreductase [Spirosoma sp. KCTC 42546]QDK83376.1 FAD-dependent oxidoreductase [Spirosoma sp. KCTC 42546]
MIREQAADKRTLKTIRHDADLIVVGGGLSGVCCAITAARAGIRVVLVQDRPVLGGNSSSEVRLWVLGATSHMGNNNRWAREGGVIDELLLENLYRNPEGNPLIFDTILLEKVVLEPNITLLLNTVVYEVEKSNAETISGLRAFCSQNSTAYDLVAPLFCDASGDGIVGFQAGAAFRMGAERHEEFGEKFAPTEEYGELLGHSLYFYTKDTGRPVRFVPPAYALDDITKIPRYKRFNAQEYGCQLWWIEYGGRLDTVHDTETIKWELWKVVYGVWNYIKNSGQFPEAETMTLEWIGQIPGKRESRRFEGDYMLTQQDVVEQRTHPDAVAFGGWSIDLHPADGIFSEKPGCNQWHSKGIYQIPFRSLYSHNITNLFLAGRIISASHVAFGSSRVMATGAHVAQAVGMAAAVATRNHLLPRDLTEPTHIRVLQQELLKAGQHIPGIELKDDEDLVQQAKLSASSEFVLSDLPPDGPLLPLTSSAAQMLPLPIGPVPQMTAFVTADQDTTLTVELRRSSKPFNHTPDVTLETLSIPVRKGKQELNLPFTSQLSESQYGFVMFMKNEHIHLQYSQLRVTGVLSVFNKINPAVSNYGKQEPTEDIGVDTFEFWCPERRPAGHNIALRIQPGIRLFSPANVRNGIQRPTNQPNAWVADVRDANPTLTLNWPTRQKISRVELRFDTDFDHPLETVIMIHPETIGPFCVQEYVVCNDQQERIFHQAHNHQTNNTIRFEQPIETSSLTIHLKKKDGLAPASLMEIRCYAE